MSVVAVRSALCESRQASVATLWLSAFLLGEFACQIALLFPTGGAFRLLIRTAAFGGSLALLFLIPGIGRKHPAAQWALACLVVVALNLLHPTTNTLLAGLAQFAMYLAILAPLFWVGRLSVSTAGLTQVLFILWAFHSLSAGFGVLQVYYPGRFQPNLSSVLVKLGDDIIDSLHITLANGQEIFRPMGLTDTPGGAATSGLYAFLFGLGFFLGHRSWLLRLAGVGSMGIGLFCTYLSQVRSLLVMMGIGAIVFAFVLGRRGELSRLVGLALAVPIVVVSSFTWAAAVGGDSVTDRLTTLVEDRPGKVYRNNRGLFLEHTINVLLPEYPMGAGLGRWGMMNLYFGDNGTPERASIWVELQWTGWLLDGGLPLILLYSVALIAACWMAWRIAIRARHGTLEVWAALILAYNVGAIAVTFNYPIFLSQLGLEFWLLNACLFAAAVSAARRPRQAVESKDTTHPGVRFARNGALQHA